MRWPAREESRIGRTSRAFEAADRYFLSESIRAGSANELAHTRIGPIGSFAVGDAELVSIPWLRHHWPLPVLLAMSTCALLFVALPFLLRQQPSIGLLGHFVCAQVTAYAGAVVVLSSGRATGILPVLPMIPMLALLMRGGRAVLGWGLVTIGVIGIGALLSSSDAQPPIASFRET